jgi:hypothetical protein
MFPLDEVWAVDDVESLAPPTPRSVGMSSRIRSDQCIGGVSVREPPKRRSRMATEACMNRAPASWSRSPGPGNNNERSPILGLILTTAIPPAGTLTLCQAGGNSSSQVVTTTTFPRASCGTQEDVGAEKEKLFDELDRRREDDGSATRLTEPAAARKHLYLCSF